MENVAQFERKRHTELDNIEAVAQFMATMRALPDHVLDPERPLDVMKYACALGDPRTPGNMPSWMRELLAQAGRTAPTMANKILAVAQRTVSKQWLMTQKVGPALRHLVGGVGDEVAGGRGACKP